MSILVSSQMLDAEEDKVVPAKPSPAEIETARLERAQLRVNHRALINNVQAIRTVSNGAKVMAVIKGNAYGLGARALASTLEQTGVDAFAVDNVGEGLDLRAAGITLPVMIIDGGISANVDLALRWKLTPGIAHQTLLQAYQDAARRAGVRYPVWLVANVGFNRSGYISEKDFLVFLQAARGCANLQVVGVYAHMTNAHADEDISLAQITRYFECINLARSVFGSTLWSSLFASHGIPRWCADYPTDWVRPGLLMYGEHMFSCEHVGAELPALMAGFEPAIELRARVIQVLHFDHDDYLGYGHCHRVRAGSRIATLAFGFGRGYPPGTPKVEVVIKGRRYPLIGAVGMDAVQVDISEGPDIEVGTWATLLGDGDGGRISAGEVAMAGGLSPYEFLSRLECGRHHLYLKQ